MVEYSGFIPKTVFLGAPMNCDSTGKFDLDDYLQRRSATVDLALESYLIKYPGAQQTIFRAMRYGVFPGGKRIRPILVLATGELFGAPQSSLLPFACAIEMVHAYSLIHDDLPALDDDELRRGAPTAHKVFGEGMALLAGDALLTEAFHLMSSPNALRCAAPELVVRLIHELSHAAGVGGLVGGQALDVEAENENDVDLATVEWIHVRKTGALILASVRIGAQVAGAQAADLGRVSRYGERLGLAFQIADDILDALGQTAAGEGAESSHNERKKATYPSVVGIPQARETLKELLQRCLDELATYGAQAVPLKAIARHVVARAIHCDSK
jgi:geranylgeranyl diphosphate synthase type II